MPSKEQICVDISAILNEICKTEVRYDACTPLLRAGCLMDSLSILSLATHCEEKYGIDLLEDDINLDCFDTIDSLAACVIKKLP